MEGSMRIERYILTQIIVGLRRAVSGTNREKRVRGNGTSKRPHRGAMLIRLAYAYSEDDRYAIEASDSAVTYWLNYKQLTELDDLFLRLRQLLQSPNF
jgi:hypothetical protein